LGYEPDELIGHDALEFIRICEALSFRDIVVSMKASNPRVMLAATRLVAAKMDAAGWNYPLHLGVTEAGGGEDARVKSAIGIGTILSEGIGDTIRVSLTEDPVAEVPVAKALAEAAFNGWQKAADSPTPRAYAVVAPKLSGGFSRRQTHAFSFGPSLNAGGDAVPRAALAAPSLEKLTGLLSRVTDWHAKHPLMKAEALILPVTSARDAALLPLATKAASAVVPYVFAEIAPKSRAKLPEILAAVPDSLKSTPLALMLRPENEGDLAAAFAAAKRLSLNLIVDVTPASLYALLPTIAAQGPDGLAFTSSRPESPLHPARQYRLLAEMLDGAGLPCPIWIRHTKALMEASRGSGRADDTATIMDAALLAGGLLSDGIGDILS
ncbi:MAG TPA: flavodoxin-dependent (E)-4-hydroxy-3-methylbut-2-enyl-diphosphate synthase, partial [Opitutales bacterium]|nr:flavodoxin-dependent (E)-4-hydroxy-3-methylbut-2-enyl-diphosphate synthase [Opitutales bacterium]